MEYMAVGKPIVGFRLAETRFSAQHSALYVDAHDEREFAVQVARLMDDPALRSELGQRGRHRIRKQLAWQYSVPKLLDSYDQCLRIRPVSRKSSNTRSAQEQPVSLPLK